jgi:Domain of unknown function (DUF397)
VVVVVVIMDWRKSSFSGSGGECVQVRQDLAAIRDSKRPGAGAAGERPGAPGHG